MNWSCTLFGLEDSDLNISGNSERRNFKVLSLGFIVMIIAVFISNIYLFYLLSIPWFISCLGCLTFTLIVFCVLRFCFVSVGSNLHEKVSFKSGLFNNGNLLKFPLFLFFLFIFSVPVFTLFYHEEFNPKIDTERQLLVTEHNFQNQKTVDANVSHLKLKRDNSKIIFDSLQQLKTNCINVNELVELNVSLNFFLNKYREDSLSHMQKRKELISFYEDDLFVYEEYVASIDFPFTRFLLLLNDDSKRNGLFAFVAFLFSFLPFYIYTLCSQKFTYLTKANKRKKEFVIRNYEATNKELQKYYFSKFKYSWKPTVIYKDAPFNQTFVDSKFKEFQDFNLFDHFK